VEGRWRSFGSHCRAIAAIYNLAHPHSMSLARARTLVVRKIVSEHIFQALPNFCQDRTCMLGSSRSLLSPHLFLLSLALPPGVLATEDLFLRKLLDTNNTMSRTIRREGLDSIIRAVKDICDEF
jgi:hypothetical protein